MDWTPVIRVLLVDDQHFVRQGIRMRFALEPDILIVGEASDGQAALKLAGELHPDVVLMDVQMPVLDGISAASTLHSLVPQTAVILMSIHGDSIERTQAQAAGVAAFIEKTGGAVHLLSAIRTVAQNTGAL
jgi:DNA-binding NarL/FixJ family response regulator